MADEAGALIRATCIEPETGTTHLLLSSLRTEELKTLGGLDAPTIRAAFAAGV